MSSFPRTKALLARRIPRKIVLAADDPAVEIELLASVTRGVRDELVEVRRTLAAREERLAEMTRKGADHVIRKLLARMVGNFERDDLCFIGPNGCQSHPAFDMGGECGFAWINSWIETPRAPNEQGAAGTQNGVAFGLLVADHQDALPLIAEALEAWLTAHEPTIAGATGTYGQRLRQRGRLARDLVHTAKAQL